MVSCEGDTTTSNNYDYLAFFIDDVEQGRWDQQDGWEFHEFPVATGYHRLEWRYHKDHNVNRGYDAAWVDLISFPAPVSAGPELETDPAAIEWTLKPGELEYDTLYLHNSGPGDVAFTIDIAGMAPAGIPSANRSMSGSTLVSSQEKVHTGKAYSWDLRTYCASTDSEWTRDIYIEFPEGIELTVGNEFTGGSGGPLLFEGPAGNGVTSHWHGEDENGWGVIHGTETATSQITFYVHNYLSGNPAMHYEIHGDIYGSLPHVVNGTLPILNLGPEVEWLSPEVSEGIIAGGITMPVVFTLNTEGMTDGTYQAWILVSDNHFNEQTIPVTLTLDTYLGTEDVILPEHGLTVFPNPFSHMVNLSFISGKETYGHLEISNALGNCVFSGSMQVVKGKNTVIWDGKGNDHQEMATGVYFGRLSAGDDLLFFKMIKSR